MRPTRQQIAITATVPAPVGGLNARDQVSAMPPTDAVALFNMFPDRTSVATRKGFSTHATHSSIGVNGEYEGWSFLATYAAGSVETLIGGFSYSETVGTTKRRCRIDTIADNGTITAAREISAVGTAETISSIGEWGMHTSGSAATYFVLCASLATVFTPQGFDGAAWSALAITGCPADTLGVHSHRTRLWFYNGTTKPLSVFYLPAGAITGAVTEFNLGLVASRGGRIVSMRTWAMDGGDGGMDDVAVFYTSEGQVIVYSGTDPASSSTWQLVGVFQIGKPASRYGRSTTDSEWGNYKDSFAMKYGADVLFLCEDGLTSATRVIRPVIDGTDYSISAKIRPLLSHNVNYYLFQQIVLAHWKMAVIPGLRHLIINTVTGITTATPPVAPTNINFSSLSYVMNTETGAWTVFGTSLISPGGKDMAVYKGYLYCINGNSTRKVYKYGLATDDDGTAITFNGLQAYNYFDSPNNKLFTIAKPAISGDNTFTAGFGVSVDFVGVVEPGQVTYTGGGTNIAPVVSPGKYGRAAAGYLSGTTSSGQVTWYATAWAAEPGGFL